MRAVTWPEVLRVLPDDETRSYAITLFKDNGFTVSSFTVQKRIRAVVADGLTRTEDWLECRRGGQGRRDAIRRLELELWP